MEGNKLLAEACKTYGIEERYVFAHTEHPETYEVCILTCGGKKFRHRKGEAAKFELTYTQITGELPEDEKGRAWHKKLNQRISLGGLGRLLKYSK
jgi:hypothetical protein